MRYHWSSIAQSQIYISKEGIEYVSHGLPAKSTNAQKFAFMACDAVY